MMVGAMSRRKLLALLSFSILIPSAPYLYTRIFAPHVRTLVTRPQIMDGVIVVGSGLAGLSAAAEVLARDVPVFMLERQAKPGGNSIKASSGINGAPTRFQTGPEDTTFYSDTIKSAGAALSTLREERERLISTLTGDSKSAIEWLVDQHGIDLSRVATLGGHSRARTHRPAGQMPVGASIVTTLLKELQQNPLFHLQTGCTATKVLKGEKDGAVSGVEYTASSGETSDSETKTLHGPVVFASGGFAGDSEGLLAKYRPDLAGYPSTNTPQTGSTPLLTAVGAQLLDMEMVQVHPTGWVDPKDSESKLKFLAAEVLRGEGGILLTKDGRRFYNELDTRERVTSAIINAVKETTGGNVETSATLQYPVYLLLDEATYEAAKSHVDFYIFKGLVRKTTLADLPPATLTTLKDYAAAVAGESTDSFGRTHFGHWALRHPTPETVVYVGTVTPVVHFTMGGVKIDTQGSVINESGSPIAGLWAAGEISGGVHGANRLGGNSLLECVVYGRRAGQAAVEYYERSK